MQNHTAVCSLCNNITHPHIQSRIYCFFLCVYRHTGNTLYIKEYTHTIMSIPSPSLPVTAHSVCKVKYWVLVTYGGLINLWKYVHVYTCIMQLQIGFCSDGNLETHSGMVRQGQHWWAWPQSGRSQKFSHAKLHEIILLCPDLHWL